MVLQVCVCLRQQFVLLWCCSLTLYAMCWLLWKFGPVLENFQYSSAVELNVDFSDVTRVVISFNVTVAASPEDAVLVILVWR